MLTVSDEILRYIPNILSQATNGIIVSDPNIEDNPIVYVNDAVIKKFGYGEDSFIGKNCRFLQGDDKEQKGLKAIRAAIKNKTSTKVTLRNYTKYGKLIYNQFTISPIFDENKNLKFFLGIQQDITHEKLLEKENKKLEIEKLDNAQFNAIGKLSAGISHEINTPLTVINGSLELLNETINSMSDEKLKQYMKEDLEVVQSQLNRIKNIAESFREIAGIDKFVKEEINLYRTLIIALRLTYNKSKDIVNINLLGEEFNLDIDRDKHIYKVFANARKLEQVFISIIDNSIAQLKLSGNINSNSLDIDIEKTKNSINLIFKDNGGGFDEEVLPVIFKPFKSKKKYQGFGIGLSVAKKIMDEHNFTVTAKNDNNNAIVKITIPIK